MVEIVILSGKGGTGKTSLTASLFVLLKNSLVADCDVDAPDLHLLLKPTILNKMSYSGSLLANINKELCLGCSLCIQNCRFDAISPDFVVDPISCDGCGVCKLVCPASAITLNERVSGEIYISNTIYGPMVHAKLFPGEENSGKLVTMVRMHSNLLAHKEKKEIILIDGAPGTGCPVISSVTNVKFAIVVTEPTQSGLHDLNRVLELLEYFKTKPFVVINKFDLNIEKSKEIEDLLKSRSIDVISKIPFDENVVKAMVSSLPVVEYAPYTPASLEIKKIADFIAKIAKN